jgi:hypothetical protein
MPYPVAKGEPLDPDNAYVIASYVGYDLNKTMQNGFLKISGALGALPAWIGLGKTMIEKKKYAEHLDLLDINVISREEWPLKVDTKTTPLNVDMPRGVVLDRGGGNDQEAIAMSDSATQGESAFDEFRATVVQTTVRMPLDGSGAPLRIFSPFKPEEREKGLDIKPSKIDGAPVTGAMQTGSAPTASTAGTATAAPQAGVTGLKPKAAAPEGDIPSPSEMPVGGTGAIESDMTADLDGPEEAPAATPPTPPAPTSDDVFHGIGDNAADAGDAEGEPAAGDDELW